MVVSTASDSLEALHSTEDAVNVVLLAEAGSSAQAQENACVQAVLPMPRTHHDVGNLVDLLNNDYTEPVHPASGPRDVPLRAPRIRMLLLDNHPTVRLAIRTLVEPYENIEIIDSCCSVHEANTVLDESPADIVVMELDVLGIKEWEEFCLEVRNRPQPPKIFAYSSDNFPDYVATAIRAGVDSYVHKGVDCTRLMDAIHRTCVGERVWLVGPDSQDLANNYNVLSQAAHLTNRERQIIVPLLHRHSNDEIASELYLAVQTVKNHVSNILRKVGVRNRRELFQRLSVENEHPTDWPTTRSPASTRRPTGPRPDTRP
jgi:DNA-binding NarL/FixJ family response regulator